MKRQKQRLQRQASVRLTPARSYGLQDALNVAKADATPLQAWAASVELPPQGPCLGFLEDLTGSGKTEAALILGQRLIAIGKASGIYWALPTQATANAIYQRLSRSYSRLFAAEVIHPHLRLPMPARTYRRTIRLRFLRKGRRKQPGALSVNTAQRTKAQQVPNALNGWPATVAAACSRISGSAQ